MTSDDREAVVIVLLLMTLMDGAMATTNGTTIGDNSRISAVFSDMSTTELALLVFVCAVLAILFGFLLRQSAQNRARVRQVQAAETAQWQTSLDHQTIHLQFHQPNPDPQPANPQPPQITAPPPADIPTNPPAIAQ